MRCSHFECEPCVSRLSSGRSVELVVGLVVVEAVIVIVTAGNGAVDWVARKKMSAAESSMSAIACLTGVARSTRARAAAAWA